MRQDKFSYDSICGKLCLCSLAFADYADKWYAEDFNSFTSLKPNIQKCALCWSEWAPEGAYKEAPEGAYEEYHPHSRR